MAFREVNDVREIKVDLLNTGDTDVTYSVPAQKVLGETNAVGEAEKTVLTSQTLTANVQSVTLSGAGTASASAQPVRR